MEQIIYENILLASLVVMYVYGAFSFLTLSPEGEEYTNYRVSRKIFGVIMIVWASYLVIHWAYDLRLNNPSLAISLCLSCYMPGSMLFEAAFSSLLSSQYPIRKRLIMIARNALCINVVVFANYLFVPLPYRYIGLVITAVIFVVEMVILSVRFFRIYNNAQKEGDNFYSDNIEVFIKWMPNCIYTAIAFGFAGSVLSFASNYAVSFYMFGGLLLFTYTFISLHNYMINIIKIKGLILTEIQQNQTLATEESVNNIKDEDMSKEMKCIEKELSKWVAKRGFTKKGITIEELALKVGTNRTYLSSFINTTYDLSFREWIAILRIEYAKELLLEDEDMPSNKIAERVGYSPNAFITIFSKAEKISPILWRNANKK